MIPGQLKKGQKAPNNDGKVVGLRLDIATLGLYTLYIGLSPFPVIVANEDLYRFTVYRDSGVQMYLNKMEATNPNVLTFYWEKPAMMI